MRKRALYVVTGINGSKITVSPVTESAFSQSKDSSRGIGIEVTNPQNLPLEKGSLVYVALSKHLQMLKGFLVLFLPVIAAFAGFFASKFLYSLLNTKTSESLSFVISLAFFLITSLIEFILTRNTETVPKPVIIATQSID
ncbi:MAG: SoxR reducing system RseC family protein [Treponema sp.]|nr:SoxR reducing system RseC family protein [Treponema sp.]